MAKFFNNQFRIAQLKRLHAKGWGASKIGLTMGVDHSSVVYQLQKLGLKKGITHLKNKLKREKSEAIDTRRRCDECKILLKNDEKDICNYCFERV